MFRRVTDAVFDKLTWGYAAGAVLVWLLRCGGALLFAGFSREDRYDPREHG